jgi:uncharacterized membrane protein YfcA
VAQTYPPLVAADGGDDVTVDVQHDIGVQRHRATDTPEHHVAGMWPVIRPFQSADGLVVLLQAVNRWYAPRSVARTGKPGAGLPHHPADEIGRPGFVVTVGEERGRRLVLELLAGDVEHPVLQGCERSPVDVGKLLAGQARRAGICVRRAMDDGITDPGQYQEDDESTEEPLGRHGDRCYGPPTAPPWISISTVEAVSLLVLLGVGVLTGVTTVLFGFGGGFVTVPAVYMIVAAAHGGDAMHTAVATSTAVMIVNAGWATVATYRQGRLKHQYLWPITVFIGIGAALGAYTATLAPERLLHWLFVAYIAATIVDCLARSGFVSRSTEPSPLSTVQVTAGGTAIGAIACFLGVGGSVMTVPLLRRKGVDMATATSMANPLSLPVAVVGSLVYAIAGPMTPGAGQLGHIDVAAAATLLAGSLPAIAVVKRILHGRSIPDRVHAVSYVMMLAAVLVAMAV